MRRVGERRTTSTAQTPMKGYQVKPTSSRRREPRDYHAQTTPQSLFVSDPIPILGCTDNSDWRIRSRRVGRASERKRLREAEAVGWGLGIGIQARDQVVSAVGSGETVV